MQKIAPEIQGRLFAANALVIQVVSAIATLFAGSFAERVFEPLLMPDGSLAGTLGIIFGTSSGALLAIFLQSGRVGMS